ncbi:biopolymer transporter [Methylobacillus sp. MM3]|jgi:biopolymer transport protein ExbD|uniref:ExbD/TolR family protein n=1 Tax=Methylobacillus sp. MM3 TaxID=1848039 RepID=UPI0007DFCABA|nr:biopolymer transporter ExbD [Methylobacillus sp. MM3]OAJ70857.1 biopolymer transporter [Methylobacillus sp. MM3]
MAMNSGNDDNMMSEINVTPLVDVMLVLLTVFIVTAPLLMNAVPVKLPKATASISITQLKNARISITDRGDIYFNDALLAMPELNARLKEAAGSQDFSVEILADEKVEYGVVAKVMAAIQRAGIARFTFVMLPEVKR